MRRLRILAKGDPKKLSYDSVKKIVEKYVSSAKSFFFDPWDSSGHTWPSGRDAVDAIREMIKAVQSWEWQDEPQIADQIRAAAEAIKYQAQIKFARRAKVSSAYRKKGQ